MVLDVEMMRVSHDALSDAVATSTSKKSLPLAPLGFQSDELVSGFGARNRTWHAKRPLPLTCFVRDEMDLAFLIVL